MHIAYKFVEKTIYKHTICNVIGQLIK